MSKQHTWPDLRLSVAPMMDWTDRHDRVFLRGITKYTRLYTEMVVTGAVLYGDKHRFLDFDPQEHPLALQLGGSDPADLARCTKIADQWGYDEINLNVGCPSDRVSSGRFGACLMATPLLVRDCLNAMQEETDKPVTVKHRIGIDQTDSYDELCRFIETVAGGTCRTFIIHARKAWLNGLSPKQNREVPPLRHDVVHRIKKEFPELQIVLNGGLGSIDECRPHLGILDGCMIGRAAYQTPWILSEADSLLTGDAALQRPDRIQVLERFTPHIKEHLARGVPLHHMTRHVLGLFHGMHGARTWRRYLSENTSSRDAGLDVWERSIDIIRTSTEKAVSEAI
ncbi:tRNA dihydrouridine(20/20a) synthase DusA [Haematospirillum jordaniae]|uniref:tRNA-dihydrouridine(20/20a) synthase n=1 Tax=Haematospirillum jordaniae TaxID=1549855 RepID=A0A143DEE0_9PROT|nr:tRNA dihydrouridine(20/20a) synthase DusA [Haematospirillum jordaniae]AMW35105.1 tRNA dihydrouridine synthase DusA [Haematospirillum jordaniae]NKD44136.1 tRNA dihydrouridine(20/20a) synthase DusA [Haematospirillum jordaniae]NKD56514.1 tRNA dihydrouridine(20/20a) synthase DusA [Haematospirillum jordaniae]NKD58572.1 tRNA dihydrouridine(20/20a) synthase DusA [Haematospirillum jordaniae]NKD66259.1 tRNA dihydrouridine(20/20a) synthase DusA [Haematospirillum jordaniae]